MDRYTLLGLGIIHHRYRKWANFYGTTCSACDAVYKLNDLYDDLFTTLLGCYSCDL